MGAFVDFWIGKRDEARLKSLLETWWLRLSDVRWGTLGRDEALFAVQVIERLFGRRALSIRRFASTAVIIFLSFCLVAIHCVLEGIPIPWGTLAEFNNLLWLVLVFLFINISLSITHFAAAQAGKYLNKRPYLNLLGIIVLLYFQYLVFCFSRNAMNGIQITLAAYIEYFVTNWHAMTLSSAFILICGMISIAAEIIWSSLTHLLFDFHPIYTIEYIISLLTGDVGEHELIFILIVTVANATPAILRLSITLIFVGSFLLQALQRPIMALWARIIESDKPVFTLLFGGVAAIAKTMQDIVNSLT